jgi:hypothetical protein
LVDYPRRRVSRFLPGVVNASEVLDGLAALPGARDSGAHGNGIIASRLLNGIEYACASAVEEPKLRASRNVVRVVAPRRSFSSRTIPSNRALCESSVRSATARRGGSAANRWSVWSSALCRLSGCRAVRLLAEELDRLDTERIAGLKVGGLGTEHLYGSRLPESRWWSELRETVDGASRAGWRELLNDLGYTIEPFKPAGYLAKAGGHPAIVVHPHANAFLFARLDEQGRLPEAALIATCRQHGAAYGVLAAGTRQRLLAAGPDEAGATTRYLELDAAALEPDMRPLLGLLSPAYLVDGAFRDVLGEARDYGQDLRRRLDRVLRQDVLPVLGRELAVCHGLRETQNGRPLD